MKYRVLIVSALWLFPFQNTSASQKKFSSERLGIVFRYPNAFTVREDCGSYPICLDCRGEVCRLSVEVKLDSMEKVIEESSIFEKQDGKWVYEGKGRASEANKISGPGWKGMEGSNVCGTTDENGHNQITICRSAVLSDGSSTAVIHDLSNQSEDEWSALIQSIRFKAKP